MRTCPECRRLSDRLSATPPPTHPVMTAPQQWMQEECPSDAPEAEPTDEAIVEEAVPPQSCKGFDLCDVGDRLLTYVWDCGSLYTKVCPCGTMREVTIIVDAAGIGRDVACTKERLPINKLIADVRCDTCRLTHGQLQFIIYRLQRLVSTSTSWPGEF